MVRWLPPISELLRRRAERQRVEDRRPPLDLLVLEGGDAGLSFTVDADQVTIGRGRPAPGAPRRPDRLWLRDPSVSVDQAVIVRDRAGTRIVTTPGATNPTLVNGHAAETHEIAPGDRIQMGRIVIEVRAHQGPGLSGLFEVPRELGRPPVGGAERDATEILSVEQLDRTEVRPVASTGSHLLLISGIDGWEEKRFWLTGEASVIGRHPDCEVSLPESGVSRRHAEIVRHVDGWEVVHRSRVNPTLVNGRVVGDRQALTDGDEIRLADRVLLRLIVDPEDFARVARPAASLRERMEEKLRWEQQLRDEFAVHGGFLDVDVVDSYGMKSPGTAPEAQVVSFERFRAFVGGVVREHLGVVLNSNGDELMCFFENAAQGALAASVLLERLQGWNESENALPVPFRVRCGYHVGDCLLDRERGIAYSEVLDTAGHLQKAAEPDGLLISSDALRNLPSGSPFESAGKQGKNGVEAYRLVGRMAVT